MDRFQGFIDPGSKIMLPIRIEYAQNMEGVSGNARARAGARG